MFKKLIVFLCIVPILYVGVFAETAESIFEKSIDAAGGVELFSNIKTLQMNIKLTMMGNELPINIFIKDRVNIRVEMNFLGHKSINIVNEKKGWTCHDTVFTEIPAEQLELAKKQLKAQTAGFISEIADWSELKFPIELIGEEDVEGYPAYKVNMIKDGKDAIQYIDKTSYLATKMTTTSALGGNDMEVEIFFKDYKEVSGIKFPHLMKIKSGGQDMGQAIIEKIKINEPVDDKLFEKP